MPTIRLKSVKVFISMRALYRDKKLTAVFQPHLYTRTRDFYQDFADSLSLLDEVNFGGYLSGTRETYSRSKQPIDLRQSAPRH